MSKYLILLTLFVVGCGPVEGPSEPDLKPVCGGHKSPSGQTECPCGGDPDSLYGQCLDGGS